MEVFGMVLIQLRHWIVSKYAQVRMMQHLNELEIKMKFSYRITKYHKYSNEDKKILCTSPEEWTSFSDVGKGLVSLNEYTKIESEYICLILKICKLHKIKSLKIKELDNFNHLKQYSNNQKITNEEDLIKLLKLILREKIWCKLCSRNCEFHFGYDYYLYCICNKDLYCFFNTSSTTLNIEKYISPYIKYKQIKRIKPF